jgi:predicted protein tyrosine phosphatase
MKVLCLCHGGNVRSVALAFVLKHEHGHEAIAAGQWTCSPKTMHMLCKWADKIVVMQPQIAECVPPPFRAKTVCVDVGPDRFGVYIHPDLLEMVRSGAVALTGIRAGEVELEGVE